MEYQYKCRITAWDFFRLTMRQTYRSMAGMCNLVFTVAMILLTAKFWSQSGEVLQVLMLIGCLLFPVIQPAAIYAKARRQAAAVPQLSPVFRSSRIFSARIVNTAEFAPFFIFFTVPSSSTIPVNITLHLTLYKKIISYSDYFAVF